MVFSVLAKDDSLYYVRRRKRKIDVSSMAYQELYVLRLI